MHEAVKARVTVRFVENSIKICRKPSSIIKSQSGRRWRTYSCICALFIENVNARALDINEYFTFSLYSNVCRSLFEKHKLHFAFLLCIRIQMRSGLIDQAEWRFLLSGAIPSRVKTIFSPSISLLTREIRFS